MEHIEAEVLHLEQVLNSVGNSSQLIQLTNLIEAKQLEIDNVLVDFTNGKTLSHQSTLRNLEISRIELSSTVNRSRNLKNLMEDANNLGYHISQRVRVLDEEKGQILTLKNYVDNVQTLKIELNKVNDAISRKDWHVAAQAIGQIRKLPEEIINDQYVEFKVPTSDLDEEPSKLINKWINQLEILFVDSFNEAASKKDMSQLSYFFQLFPLIGKSNIGLKCYSKFICNIINESSRSILKSANSKNDKPEIYAQILFKLYQTVSTIITQHSRVIKSYYGKEVLTKILKDIQIECDMQSNLIFDTYSDVKQLNQYKENVQKYDYPILVREITQTGIENDETENDENNFKNLNGKDNCISLPIITSITDELSAMMSHWAMYSKFFAVFWNESNNDDRELYPSPLILSTFANKIRNVIISTFDTLSTFVIRRTLEQACIIESLTDIQPFLTISVEFLTLTFKNLENSTNNSISNLLPEDPPISSITDDVILSLNTILMEILATGEFLTIRNMISNIKRILINDFITILHQRMNKLILRQTSKLLTNATIQKIHAAKNHSVHFLNSGKSTPSRSGTPSNTATDLANSTSVLFLKSINAAISTMTGDEDDEYLVQTGHINDVQKYVIYLNTLSTMGSYMDKLIDKFSNIVKNNGLLIIDERKLNNVKSAIESNSNTEIVLEIDLYGSKENTSTNNNAKIIQLLHSLNDGFKERANIIINEKIVNLYDKVLNFKIVKLIKESISSSYLISSDEFENNQISNNDGNRLAKFVKEWNSLIIPYATTMAKPEFQKLLTLIVNTCVISIEDKFWSLENKVNAIGAIKLEQDVSYIIGELCKFDYSLKNKFMKITQAIMLAGLDDDELTELEKDGMEWALTPSERNKVKQLRAY